MKKPDICIGIDLGTSHSVIAWGGIGYENDLIGPEILEIPRLDVESEILKNPPLLSIKDSPLLSSCVYFPEKDSPIVKEPIVGEYGKWRTDLEDIERIGRSFKIDMGKEDSIREIDGKFYSPIDFSCLVLKKLMDGAVQRYFRNTPFPDDVAIAVPASFSEDMGEATLDAAEKAGFKKSILVDEPQAVLYDLYWAGVTGQAPHIFFEQFADSKLYLIFDLGGGTLDVSLYEVRSDNNSLEIKQISVSRFTEIGGDNFDKELATLFLNEYRERHSIEQFDSSVEARFCLSAEAAKIRLNTQVEMWEIYGQSDELDKRFVKTEIHEMPLEGKFFEFELSLVDYEKCVESLLAPNLTMASINQYDSDKGFNNIIEPIFDALKKAEKELGYIPKPDIVLLNGSMSRDYTIRKRLENFFGFPPICPHHRETAIATGAVVWRLWASEEDISLARKRWVHT